MVVQCVVHVRDSVDPERQTGDWVLDGSKVNKVTRSLAESYKPAEVLKGRSKAYKYLGKDKVNIGTLLDKEGKKMKEKIYK